MTFDALRSLASISEHRSITKAAGALGYSQSALSRQIAGLEAHFGVTLLERHARGVEVTAAGRLLVEHARVIISRMERAERELKDPTQPAVERLRVGAVPTASAFLLPKALSLFAAGRPAVTVAFVEDVSPRLLPRLLDSDLDVAVVTDYPPGLPADNEFTFVNLSEDPLVCLLSRSHPFARRRTIDLADLADEVWVEDYQGAISALRAACAKVGFVPRVEIECGGWLGTLSFVAAGLGITLAPRLLVPALPAGLIARPLADPPIRNVYAAQRNEPSSDTATAFIDMLRQASQAG